MRSSFKRKRNEKTSSQHPQPKFKTALRKTMTLLKAQLYNLLARLIFYYRERERRLNTKTMLKSFNTFEENIQNQVLWEDTQTV